MERLVSLSPSLSETALNLFEVALLTYYSGLSAEETFLRLRLGTPGLALTGLSSSVSAS